MKAISEKNGSLLLTNPKIKPFQNLKRILNLKNICSLYKLLNFKVYFARNGRSAGKLPGGSLLTVACQSAAIAVTSKARNTLGRRAAREMLPAAHLGHPDRLDQDVLVCGDDPAAKDPALELGSHLVSGRSIDAGPLANSRALEGMTAVILHVNRRYRVVAGLRLTGLP